MIRFLDLTLALAAVVGLLPLLVLVALILSVTGEKEIFFIQQRVGQNKTKFGLIKFATMLKDSPNLGTGTITIKDDPRVLPVGHFLRKTKINELPQLFNVLAGHMSIIGPRPLAPSDFSLYPEHLKTDVASVKPGLSGIGSIVFRHEETLMDNRADPVQFYKDVIAPYKADLECWFVEHRGLKVYWQCIVLTLCVVIFSRPHDVRRYFDGLPVVPGNLRAEFSKATHV